MPIYKRKGSPYYNYDFRINGLRFRGSTKETTRTRATEFERREVERLRKTLVYGHKRGYTLTEAFGRYWEEYGHRAKSAQNIQRYITVILNYFGARADFSSLTNGELSKFVAHLKSSKKSKGDKKKLITASTINHHIKVIRRVHKLAKKVWEIDAREIDFTALMQKTPEQRTRWITTKEAARLIELAQPHIKGIILFALCTGARYRNIVDLRWKDVDLKRGVAQFVAKGDKTHSVPLPAPIREYLLDLHGKDTKREDLVFTYNGERIGSIKRTWKTLLRNAGIKDLRFHDLRHTCASWLVQGGTPIEVTKEILGHSHISTTLKYAHHRQQTQKEALEKIMRSQFSHNQRAKKPKSKAKSRRQAA